MIPSTAQSILEDKNILEVKWNECLEIIKSQISTLSFKTWFQPIVPVRLENKNLTIQVPSQFFYDWLEEHYNSLLKNTILSVIGDGANLFYLVSTEELSLLDNPKDNFEANRSESAKTHPFSPHIQLRTENILSITNNLNPKYTFDNFIKGDCNQLARAAALAVANNPGGTSFNPLFFYGGTGLGKTHLMHALGNHAASNGKAKKITYTSSEKFTVDFVESIQGDKVSEFSSFYRNMDILIVDDIQFFSGKEKTQDNFFHIFNTLYQLGKQVVLSSDVSPKELKGLDERLISRFQSGLTADLQQPDLETRIAILRKKSEENGLEISSEVIDFIAANATKNVRELEGCIIRLVARASFQNREIDLDLAKEVLEVVVSNVKTPITMEYIQKSTSEFFDIPLDLLRSKTRRKEVVIARQTAMYIAKELTSSSLKTIGMHFNGRDHSTVIHACQTVEELIRSDKNYKKQFEQLKRKIELGG